MIACLFGEDAGTAGSNIDHRIIRVKRMGKKPQFRFNATVSDRGQIFIPKALQNYFGIKNRDRVAFIVQEDGRVVFKKREGVK